jgi:hypothetical protein
MIRRASVETLDDVIKSIKSFGDVNVLPDDAGSVKIEAWPFTIKVKQHDVLYHWTLQAIDDPSDRDEGFASEPLDEILESLSEDTPGGEIWKQFASNPQQLILFLRKISAGPVGRREVLILKRIAGFLAAGSPSPLLSLHAKEIENLMKEMNDRNWRATAVEDDSGLPAIEFEIGETYEGKIMLSKVMYEYEFELEDHPDLAKSGISDSVIKDLREWTHNPSVSEASDEMESDIQTGRPGARPALDDRPTGADRPIVR